MKYILYILLLLVSGCATFEGKDFSEVVTSKEALAVCQVADVVTTAGFLATGKGVELNPIVNALHIKGLGAFWGTMVPVIGLTIASYYIIKALNEPVITGVATVAECTVSANNLLLILK